VHREEASLNYWNRWIWPNRTLGEFRGTSPPANFCLFCQGPAFLRTALRFKWVECPWCEGKRQSLRESISRTLVELLRMPPPANLVRELLSQCCSSLLEQESRTHVKFKQGFDFKWSLNLMIEAISLWERKGGGCSIINQWGWNICAFPNNSESAAATFLFKF
jgi:hypothetical protein